MLVQANGQPLPAVIWEDPAGSRLELVGETLVFRPFARVERTRILRTVEPGAGTSSTTTIRRTTYYRVREEPTEVSAPGIVLRLGSLIECPPVNLDPAALSVACDPEEQAVVHDGELTLTSIVYGAMDVRTLAMRFVRYDPADYVEVDAWR